MTNGGAPLLRFDKDMRMMRAGETTPRLARRLGRLCLLVLAWGLLSSSPAAMAQAGPTTRPATSTDVTPSLPTADAVQAHVKRLEQAKDLAETVRTQAVDAYKQALAQLQIAGNWRSKAEMFEAGAKEAPAKLVAVRKELAGAGSQPTTTTAPAEAALAELERLLGQAQADVTAAKKAAADLESEPKRRSERHLEIAKLSAAAQPKLAEVDKKLAEPAKESHPELAAAQRVLLQAQREALTQELAAYQKELAAYEAERDLLTARADLTARRVTLAARQVKDLQAAVDVKRKEEADRAAREAARAAASAARAHPVLSPVAQESARVANERTGTDGLTVKIPRATKELEGVKARLAQLQQDLKGLREKEKIVGRTATFGVLLRKQRAELPHVSDYTRQLKDWQAQIAAAHLRLIELRERRRALSDVDAAARGIVAQLDTSVAEAQRARVAEAAKELLESLRKNLDELIRDYDTYFAKLLDLTVQVQSLIAQVEEVAAYIGERVLWIRSAPPLGLRDVPVAFEAGQWLIGPKAWGDAAKAFWADACANPAIIAAGAILFAMLIALRRRCVRRLEQAGKVVSQRTAAVFAPTLWAVALTALLATTLPALIGFVAWRLANSPDGGAVKAVAEGLSTVAAIMLTFGALSQICRPNGLAEAHFRTGAKVLGPLRTRLLLLTILLGAMGFLVSGIEAQGSEEWKSSLGRAALIVALVTIAAFAWRMLRPSAPLWKDRSGERNWVQRLRLLWYVLAIPAPLLLALLAILGYYYTALHLTGRLAATFWFVAGLAIASAIGQRWLAVMYRHYVLRRVRRQREEQAAAEGDVSPGAAEDSEMGLQLSQVNKQNQRLLRTVAAVALVLGVWWIWAESLPALTAARRVDLWTQTVKETLEVAAPDGQTHQQTIEKVVPVTLADAGLAVLSVVLTVAAVRNIPGLLEVAVLQRVRLDAGARYAISAILRYTIAVVGVVLALRMIGVRWASVQWLVAAMTVGLGFGLQEIFANFVSGLILLFERPIRIGDTVTVGETVGTVTRIRIRATTITDWDRKELIVPNKEFVTGRLVNWSLSDKVLRVILRIGIVYGSDTDLAEKVLYEKAKEHPLVLADPEPVVFFSAFGDNSLSFELRVYISGIEHYLQVWHDLNKAIDKAFRVAGITIAFPQRDTHLDTLQPLEIRILPTDEARGKRGQTPSGDVEES